MSLRTLGGQILLGPGGPLDCDDPCCGGSGPPGPCNYMIDCSDVVPITVSPGLEIPIPLSVEAACPWHAESADSWIHIEPPVSHLSSGVINYSVDANPSTVSGRTGFIQVIKTSIGPGPLICTIQINQDSAALCSGVVTPTDIFVSGGPVTINFDGSFVALGSLTPWDAQLKNIGNPCSWIEQEGVNSWLGYFVTLGAVGFNFGGSGPPGAWWFQLQTSGIGPNFWKKPYGSTPIGTYVACDQFGVQTPATNPQIITIS